MFYRRYRNSISNMERAGHISGGLNRPQNSVTLVTVETLDKRAHSEYLSQPAEKSKKKKKKKGGSKRRKSVSVDISSTMKEHTPDGSKLKRLPNILSPGRLDELASPPSRHSVAQQMAIQKCNEKKKKLPLLIAIKPENEKAEKDRFMRANFNYNPYFVYRGCVDDEVMDQYRHPSDKYIPQVGTSIDIYRKKM